MIFKLISDTAPKGRDSVAVGRGPRYGSGKGLGGGGRGGGGAVLVGRWRR